MITITVDDGNWVIGNILKAMRPQNCARAPQQYHFTRGRTSEL